MNYARRQQYRRLSHAGRLALTSATAGLLGLLVLSLGVGLVGGVLLAVAVILGLRARHWLLLAGRSRVGARCEDEVLRALAPLKQEGWRLRRGLRWRGRGDIDSVAIAPAGIGFAIETKARRYEERHLTRVREQAAWLARRRHRWCRTGALAVLCVVRTRGLEKVDHNVFVVSIDRLIPVLRGLAPVERKAGDPRPTARV